MKMSTVTYRNRSIGLLTCRLILGFIFLMQGFGKVFTWGVNNVYENYFAEAFADVLPTFILLPTAYYTSYVELIGGALLIVGYKRDWALYALASVLVIVSFGHGLTNPIWDLTHVMFRAILLLALLLLPSEWDTIRIESLMASKD